MCLDLILSLILSPNARSGFRVIVYQIFNRFGSSNTEFPKSQGILIGPEKRNLGFLESTRWPVIFFDRSQEGLIHPVVGGLNQANYYDKIDRNYWLRYDQRR